MIQIALVTILCCNIHRYRSLHRHPTMTDTITPIIVYAMPGSQFTFKVLAALGAKKIPHYVEFVATQLEKRRLPSGGTMVPEIKVGKGDDAVIVSDSEKILHWLDENRNTNFFPNEKASELSIRASGSTLAALVWYYNWVDDKGYNESMRLSIAKLVLPSWICVLRGELVDLLVASERQKYGQKVSETLGVNDTMLTDSDAMKKMLMDELNYFQSLLSPDQSFLLAGTEPTAADFSLYAQLERLVGAGTASDVFVAPAMQELKENGSGLNRLWQWHDLMRERYPVKFKGKRVPKAGL